MKPGDQIALIDLDGTIADYDTRLGHYMRQIQSPTEPTYTGRYLFEEPEPLFMEARRKLIQSSPGFWRTLTPLHVGFQVVEILREIGFVLHILTKGPKTTPTAWTEKVEWCIQHIPDAFVNISSDKSLHYGKVLVDDYPPYFEGWLEQRPRGLVVCVAQPWNIQYAVGGTKALHNVFRFDGTEFDLLKQRLEAAFNRKSGEPIEEERRARVQGDGNYNLRMDDSRRKGAHFPGSVSWAEHEEAWRAYSKKYGNDQDAERINQRGGFGYNELTELLGHEPKTWVVHPQFKDRT